jgi:acetamidase/formamidase
MHIRQIGGILVVTLLSCSTSHSKTPPPADLTGDWIAEIAPANVPNADTSYVRLTLNQSGETLDGDFGRQAHSVTGSVKGGRIELHYRRPQGLETVYTATLKNGEILGRGATPADSVPPLMLRAYREKKPQLSAVTHTFEPKEFQRMFSDAIAPVLHIVPGDTVRTWTVDAGGSDSHNVRLSAGGNPQTGPFYVEGALPGDTLVIHLLSVRLNRDLALSDNAVSANALNPYYNGSLGAPQASGTRWHLDRDKGVASLIDPPAALKNYTVPLRPMLGCIAVAPPRHAAYPTGRLGAYGGNMDYNRITEGTTVYLPVFQVGALLFVGDGHAAQGDGELAGNALETSLDVEFKVELIRGAAAASPRAENADFRMAMGIGGSLNDALQEATTNMAQWLQQEYHLDRYETGSVLGTAMVYDIAEVVDGDYHVVARLSKQALAGLSPQR